MLSHVYGLYSSSSSSDTCKQRHRPLDLLVHWWYTLLKEINAWPIQGEINC